MLRQTATTTSIFLLLFIFSFSSFLFFKNISDTHAEWYICKSFIAARLKGHGAQRKWITGGRRKIDGLMPRMEPARRKHDHRAQGNERGKSRGRFFRVQGNPTRADTFSSTCGNFSISDCRSRLFVLPGVEIYGYCWVKRRPDNRFCPPSFAYIDSEHCVEAEHRQNEYTEGGKGR